MSIDIIKNQLKRYNLKPNFTYGQNFLLDEEILDNIVAAAEITAEDSVLEIGPGIGNLTEKLCQKAGFVLSIEKDPKFQPILYALKKNHRKNFRYEIADALTFDFVQHIKLANETSQLKRDGDKSEILYKVVANIPYYITGKILQMLLAAKVKPSCIVVLTQKEVAQNIVADPGDLSLLAISVQLYGQPQIIEMVPAKSFYPAPKVDSAILKIQPFEKPRYKITDEKHFFKTVKACFAGKRKQLHNSLTNNLQLPKETVLKILEALKIPASIRPQELTIQQWIELADKCKM